MSRIRILLIASISAALIGGLIWGHGIVRTFVEQRTAAVERESEAKRAEVGRLRHSGDADAIRLLHAYLDDHDARVRADAVTAIGVLASQAELKCPIAVVNALLDDDKRVREPAGILVTSFMAYEGDPTAALIRAARHADRDTRSAAVMALAKQPSRDDDVIAAITQATADPDLQVRHNAFVSHYQATGDVKPACQWCVKVLAGVDLPEADSPVSLDMMREGAKLILEKLHQHDRRTLELHLLELADRDNEPLSATAECLLEELAQESGDGR